MFERETVVRRERKGESQAQTYIYMHRERERDGERKREWVSTGREVINIGQSLSYEVDCCFIDSVEVIRGVSDWSEPGVGGIVLGLQRIFRWDIAE